MRAVASMTLTESGGVVSASSVGTTVNSGAGAGVLGSYTQLIASTAYDSYGLMVYPRAPGSLFFAYQLAVGAAAAEQPIAEFAAGGSKVTAGFFVPIFVPAGSRISVRSQSNNYVDASTVSVQLVRGNSRTPLVSYGRLLGYSSGVAPAVDTGAVAHTKGAYTQLVASTSRDAKGFTVSIKNDPGNTTDIYALLDLAIGGAGSEIVIAADIPYSNPGYYAPSVYFGPIWTPIPAGSRLAARGQSDQTVAGERKPNVSLTLWE